MSEEQVCPHCGGRLPPWSDPSPIPAEPIEAGPIEDGLEPRLELLASGSNDETFLASPSRLATTPDPILGTFVTPPSGDSDGRGSPAPGTSSSFATLAIKADREALRGDEHEEGGPDDERGTPWTSVLLASYASAITLALAWMAWQRSADREDFAKGTREADRPSIGRQAPLSREVTPPETVLAKHSAVLGRPLLVGSLEVTPLEIAREAVELQRVGPGADGERRDGGEDAWILRLKLKNRSDREVFAPLDQAFLRDQEKVLVDTFLQTGNGERIYPYPLAMESEWSIVGQDFGVLRPKEVRTVAIVSTPNAPGDESGPFVWRVRLRTGLGRTDVIEVRWPAAPE